METQQHFPERRSIRSNTLQKCKGPHQLRRVAESGLLYSSGLSLLELYFCSRWEVPLSDVYLLFLATI